MRGSVGALGLAAGLAAGIGRWGGHTKATPAEKRALLPGDELVPEPMWQATRAVTIAAPAEDVWPWLVQMGFPTERGGWYTPVWLDQLVFKIDVRSADRIIPELQQLAVGDRVPDSESGVSYFTVARIDPRRALVLLSHTHPLPAYQNVDFSWAFVLEPRPCGSRLIMRARVRYEPIWPALLVRGLIVVGFGVGDFIQAGGMLLGIRRRAQTTALTPPPAANPNRETIPSMTPHAAGPRAPF